jgi:hypothetical protein
MANEYLKRTPTSTGNRKVFTWSGWVKLNNPTPSAINSFFAAYDGSSGQRSSFYLDNDKITWSIGGNGAPGMVETTTFQRDYGNWTHYMIACDTTKASALDRSILYINGNQIPLQAQSGQSLFVQNQIGQINGTWQHNLGAFAINGDNPIEGEFADVFLIDGQALTPDVFGYYKKGDGYISAGSTQATDFKRGQWVPKAPKVIKSVINARGGFGVNGFYLPMNDASNLGADFHCEPNSIIKLKGEDFNEYPQPRNGAPTTTDTYVSQLRTDTYAANLVLAVPGIALENTNTELVTNGTFDTGISGWTGYNSTPTWDNVNQRLAINAPTEFDGAQTSSGISVSANTNYTLSLDVFLGTAGGVRLQVRNSANSGGIALLDVDASGAYVLNFNSGANTSVYIRLLTSGGNTGTAYFDNISLKEAIPVRDYSADIKGSGTNKTLTANGNAGIAAIPSYYGSALSSAANGGFSFEGSDFAFGTGDFTFEGWFYISSDTSVIRAIFDTRTNDNNQFGLFLGINDNGNLYTYGFPSGTGVTNLGIPAINQWHHVAVERNGSIGNVYLNGVAVSTVNMSSTNYTQSGGTLMRPAAVFGDLYNFYGYIQDFRVYKGVAKYKNGFDVPRPYTPVGIATWRSVPDTTANNFATLNPLHRGQYNNRTLSNGNLTVTHSTDDYIIGNVGISTGKWYWEILPSTISSNNNYYGVVGAGASSINTLSYYYRSGSGTIVRLLNNVVTNLQSGLTNASANDVIGIALDATNKQISWYLNGSQLGVTETGISSNEDYFPLVANFNSSVTKVNNLNFGQNPTFSGNTTAGTFTDSNGKGLFKYEPPSGFLALCEDNLPTPAIKNPGEHFKTILWTGDGNVGRSITGVGFQPDLVWIKRRNGSSDHVLQDSVRGFGPTTKLSSSSTQHENDTDSQGSYGITDPQWGYLNSVDTDGFSLNASTNGDQVNKSTGDSYVAWCWRAGAGTTSTNTDGSIQSVVSANQDAGFSIVSWTGNGATTEQTVGHGLNKSPSFTILKARDVASFDASANDWWVYFGSNDLLRIRLNLTSSGFTNNNDSAFLQGTYSDKFRLIANGPFRENNIKYIAYTWAEIEGYSKFGSYVGNGSADGPFVYCGFKPAFVMIKASSTSGDWLIMDSSRDSTNPNSLDIYANLANVETNFDRLDFLSNGFKNRSTYSNNNGNGVTYIFAAFAESPFQTANAK